MAKIKVQERQVTIINHNDYISRVFRHLGKLYNPCFNSLEFEGWGRKETGLNAFTIRRGFRVCRLG